MSKGQSIPSLGYSPMNCQGADRQSDQTVNRVLREQHGSYGPVCLGDNPEAAFALPVGRKQPVAVMQGLVVCQRVSGYKSPQSPEAWRLRAVITSSVESRRLAFAVMTTCPSGKRAAGSCRDSGFKPLLY